MNPQIQPALNPVGDSAFLVTFGTALTLPINNAVLAFSQVVAQADERAQLLGLVEIVPTLCSVLLRYDPLLCSDEAFCTALQAILSGQDWTNLSPPKGRKLWRVPATYGGSQGPDLAECANYAGMSKTAFIEAHTQTRQRVFMLGFAPGFCYLGQLPSCFEIPRRTEIRPVVPAGALCVAIGQTVLSATEIPTGWSWIGRTNFYNFQLDQAPVFPIQAGDEVCFEPVQHLNFDKSCQITPEILP